MTSFQQLVNSLVGLANSIVPLLLAVAVIVFIWGIIRYLWLRPDSPQERKNMQNFLIMGIIAITVIISIWGIATMLKNSLFPSAPCPVGVSGCGTTPSNNSTLISGGPSNFQKQNQIQQMLGGSGGGITNT